jgi:hypothetical protein
MANEQVSLMDLSEEDFANLDLSQPITNTVETSNEEDKQEDKSVDDQKDESNEDQSQGTDKQDDTSDEQKQDDDSSDASKGTDESDTNVSQKPEGKDNEVNDKAEDKADESKEEKAASTADEIVSKLFAPFKAGGRDMQVKTVEEAIALMQMGVGFNKRMGQLKRAQKIEKMLDNNKIDEDRLSFLIDVSNKNPEAISKLVQESGIDALELDADKAKSYTPTQHSISDTEMALDEVLDELKDSPVVNRTLDIVTKDWDKASRKVVIDAPELLKVINNHVENGIYDLITAQLTIDKALGKHKGLSDIQAYQQVGDAMNAEGKFAHIGGSSPDSQQTKPTAPVVVQPKLKQAEDDEQRKQKRKAAGSTPPVVSPAKPVPGKALLDMSDEEFAKFNL